MKQRFWNPAIALSILSPILAELISGSTPPLAFFFPITLPFFIFFYGCGVLIVRELAFRWQLKWPGLLLLGGAFGVLAEAFVAGTWVDVASDAADIRWGEFLGVNWGIVFPFTLYHAVFSVGIPVFVVNRFFPERIESTWVRHGRLNWLGVGLWVVFTGAFMVVRFDPFPTTAALLITALLLLAASRSRRWTRIASIRVRPELGNRRIFLSAFFATLVIFAIGWWTRPGFPFAAVMTNVVVVLALVLLAKSTLGRLEPGRAEQPEKSLALILGAVGYLTLQGAASELIGGLGMSLIAITSTIFMIRYWRRERDDRKTDSLAASKFVDSSAPG